MSGKESIGNAVDQILQNVDWASLQDVERARECIRLLLNLVEKLNADLRKAQAENDYLREQLQRRQGGGGTEVAKARGPARRGEPGRERPPGPRKRSARNRGKVTSPGSRASWRGFGSIAKKW